MNKLNSLLFPVIIFALAIVSSTSVCAQSDSVYMSAYDGYFADRYQIILRENDRWVREDYADFKLVFLTERVVLPDTLKISGNVYEEQRGKYTHIYTLYAVCDPAISEIRNTALYNRKRNFIDSAARSKISYDNKAFLDFNNKMEGELRRTSAFFKTDCYDEFLERMEMLVQEELAFIDSIHDIKVKRAALVASNPEVIDFAFINDFLKTFNATDPDLRTLERIMVHQPEMLLSAVERVYPANSYMFILKLNQFPKDLDLTAAKTALKGTNQRNPLKRQVIREMKNKQ